MMEYLFISLSFYVNYFWTNLGPFAINPPWAAIMITRNLSMWFLLIITVTIRCNDSCFNGNTFYPYVPITFDAWSGALKYEQIQVKTLSFAT